MMLQNIRGNGKLGVSVQALRLWAHARYRHSFSTVYAASVFSPLLQLFTRYLSSRLLIALSLFYDHVTITWSTLDNAVGKILLPFQFIQN